MFFVGFKRNADMKFFNSFIVKIVSITCLAVLAQSAVAGPSARVGLTAARTVDSSITEYSGSTLIVSDQTAAETASVSDDFSIHHNFSQPVSILVQINPFGRGAYEGGKIYMEEAQEGVVFADGPGLNPGGLIVLRPGLDPKKVMPVLIKYKPCGGQADIPLELGANGQFRLDLSADQANALACSSTPGKIVLSNDVHLPVSNAGSYTLNLKFTMADPN